MLFVYLGQINISWLLIYVCCRRWHLARVVAQKNRKVQKDQEKKPQNYKNSNEKKKRWEKIRQAVTQIESASQYKSSQFFKPRSNYDSQDVDLKRMRPYD